jgi:hypothetical protein
MSALGKGGRVTASSDVKGSEKRGEVPWPIRSHTQFSTLGFRESGSQSWKEQQAHTTGPVSPRKRKADLGLASSVHDDTSLQKTEDVTAKALRVLTGPNVAAGGSENLRSLRTEIEEVEKGQLQFTQLMKSVTAVLRVRGDDRPGGQSSRAVSGRLGNNESQEGSQDEVY